MTLRGAALAWSACLALASGGCGCRGDTPAPGPVAVPTIQTARPIVVAVGERVVYECAGPEGLWADDESKAYLARPERLVLTGRADGTADVEMTFHPLPPGAKPPVALPSIFNGRVETSGLVRVPRDTPDPDTHNAKDPHLAVRYYELLATLLLLRPETASVGVDAWEDRAWFPQPNGSWFGGILRCRRLAPVTLGGRPCEQIRWWLDLGFPHGLLGESQELAASGLTFYDAEARRVQAVELEVRVAEGPPAWGFFRWDWLRLSTPEAAYRGEVLRQPWIDGAFGIENPKPTAALTQWIHEDTIAKALSGLFKGQARFRDDVRVDQDGDGKGEYGLLTELAGKANLRTPGGRQGPMVLQKDIARYGCHAHYGDTNARGVAKSDAYCFRLYLDGADGPIGETTLPSPGEARHADRQEPAGRGFAFYAWPLAPGTKSAVLYMGADGIIQATRDIEWAGLESGPPAPTLDRPEGTWEVVDIQHRAPLAPAKLIIWAKQLTVAPDAERWILLILGTLIRMRDPQVWALIPAGGDERVRELERRYREAFRDNHISAEEIQPIAEELDALVRGLAAPTPPKPR